MLIFIPNIGGADLNIRAIIDILAPIREEFLLYIHLSDPYKSLHKKLSFP